MITNHKWPKEHKPPAVLEACGKFREDLKVYSEALRSVQLQGLSADPTIMRDAGRIWSEMEKVARRLLETARLWKMDEWLSSHPESQWIERYGLLDMLTEAGQIVPSDGNVWGRDLAALLWWCEKTGRPPGFTAPSRQQPTQAQPELAPPHTHEEEAVEDYVNSEMPDLLSEIGIDLNDLLAAATEQIGEAAVRNVAPEPLSDRERAVLDIITRAMPGGITGKQIIADLAVLGIQVGQSDLTKNIIPKLRAHGVANRSGVGYFRNF